MLEKNCNFNILAISADPRELSLKFKLKGNEFYQKQNFSAALEQYNKAIVLIFIFEHLAQKNNI